MTRKKAFFRNIKKNAGNNTAKISAYEFKYYTVVLFTGQNPFITR